MPFIKKGSAAVLPLHISPMQAEAEHLTDELKQMAVALEPKKLSTTSVSHTAKGRDFDAEARGKTRCALEEAWAQSPLLPMLVKDPNDRAELHLILDEIVTERMRRVFPNG